MNAAGDINIGLAASAALLGVILGDCTTTAANEQTLVPVSVFDLKSEFLGVGENTSAMATNGDFVDIIGATGAMHIDDNAGSTKVLQLIKPYEEDGQGLCANGVWVCRCVKSQYAGTEV
jgi:hypothetical protein